MDVGFYRYSLLNRGGDRIVVEYANHLAALGNKVTLHLAHKNTVFTIHPQVVVNEVPWRGKYGFLIYGALHKFTHELVIIDIIHLVLLLSLRNRVLYFAQADDVEYYGNLIVRKVMDVLYRVYLRPGSTLITVDERLSRIFAERYGNVDCLTVTNGIDLKLFYPEPDSELMLAKGTRKAVVFMARGDHYRKGFDIAMKVFKIINPQACERMELWVCGDYLEGNAFPFTIRNFGVVSDDRLRQILSSADIFFYPSRHEGFGLFPLEAMACGCVAVTTDAIPYARKTPSIMVSDVGDVSALEKNLSMLLSDSDLYKALRNDAFMEARKYDSEKSKVAFEQALRKIVSGPKP